MDNNKRNIRPDKQKDKISFMLYIGYLISIILSGVVILKIIYFQTSYKLDPDIINYFRPIDRKEYLKPQRGDILACDGRLLAMSTPMYKLGMDCTVQKEAFKNKKDKEIEWNREARKLAEGLSTIFKNKSGAEYYREIMASRNANKRYIAIADNINYETLKKVKNLPLFIRGRNKGGYVIDEIDTRKYPYGTLARRTIGYVKDNDKSNGNNKIGIEGTYNKELHGKEGFEWLKTTDSRQRIHNYDKKSLEPINGEDIKTTLDIDIQDIADKAVRNQIADNPKVSGGCAIVMDVSTGAIRAMVNLLKDPTNQTLNESLNMAISRSGEPGSVFKAITLMSLLDSKKISLEDEIPTNHGNINGFKPDMHIREYEREHKTDKITVLHGFEISSNYVFRTLAINNFGSNPQALIDKIHEYKLGDIFSFDLEGLKKPTIPSPKSKYWSNTDLGSIAIGYTVAETPLHILTFYNAIANKGDMVKPYLVESIENNGDIVRKFGKTYLARSICSRRTADTLTRALTRVTQFGTGKASLSKAACLVAGKTGTARIAQDKGYTDSQGRVQYQGTFVGFFPADNPKYSAIVVLYSYPGTGILYGGTYPARAFRQIVDQIYFLNENNGEVLYKKGSMPQLYK